MSKSVEVTIVPEDDCNRQQQSGLDEEGIEIPWESINPDTLRNLIAEFVTRDWTDTGCTLDTTIEQVLNQLRTGQAKIVFDLVSKSCNIVPSR